MRTGRVVEPFAVAAAAVAMGSAGLYLMIMDQEGSPPTVWVLSVLAAAALIMVYGAIGRAPRRTVALIIGTAVLGLLGLVALLSIGLVILLAAALGVVAIIRVASRPRVVTTAA